MQKESEIVGLTHESQGHENREQPHHIPELRDTQTMYLWSLGITMGSFAFGYSLVLTTILGSSIENTISSSSSQNVNKTFYLSLCTTSLPVGALLGSISYTKILNTLKSENKTMILCDYCIIGLYFLQLISLHPLYMSILRFFVGFVVGISGTIIPMYLKSIAPIQISGKVGSFNQLLITVGIAVAYAMGFLIDNHDLSNQWRWRVCVLIPCIASYLRIVTCNYFQYQCIQRHIEQKNYDILMVYVEKFYNPSSFSVQKLIQSKKVDNLESGGQKVEPSSKMNKKILLAVVLTIMNQFCGINAIIFYANQLFASLSNGDSQYAVLMSFYLGLFQILFTIISGSLLDKFGRRSLMLLGETIIIFSLLGAYYVLDYDKESGWDAKFASYAIFAHIAGFSLSLGPITFIYLSEILEDISLFMVMIWIQTVLVSFFSNILIDFYGVGKLFLMFAGISILCFIYVIGAMIETKGKNKKQIYLQFNKQS